MNSSKIPTLISNLFRQDKLDPAIRDNVQIQQVKEGNKKASEKASGTLPEDNISVSEVWRKVAKNIDVKNATPSEIITVSRKLFDAGVISYDDHINLSFQPEVNLDSPNESLPFSHNRKDYIALWNAKQDNVLRFGGDRQEIEDTHRVQAILVYLDSLK